MPRLDSVSCEVVDNGDDRLDALRADVVARLRRCFSEIVRSVHTSIRDAVPDLRGEEGSDYETQLYSTIGAVIEYGLEGLEHGSTWRAPIPTVAAAQARHAAAVDVSLGTVLRQYLAGHRRFSDLIAEEAEANSLSSHALHHLHSVHEALLEHVVASVEQEYVRERERRSRTPEQRRISAAGRLLSGEILDAMELAELDHEIHSRWHLGFVAVGQGADEAFRELERDTERKLLTLANDGMVWAWLSGRRSQICADIAPLSHTGPGELSLAVGEPARGVEGWRLTHFQARATLPVAMRKPERFARYADSRLLTAALQNPTLARSLEHRYLIPLSAQRDEGLRLRQTLRTYIDLECNATSAAHVLKVGRRAVKSRVSKAEDLIGCTLKECFAELDVALRLADLTRVDTPDPGSVLSEARSFNSTDRAGRVSEPHWPYQDPDIA